VLKVCLDGVAECRPYVIVLLGDRYGWCAPPAQLAEIAAEHGFSREAVDGMSVTALEIEAGVLGDPLPLAGPDSSSRGTLLRQPRVVALHEPRGTKRC